MSLTERILESLAREKYAGLKETIAAEKEREGWRKISEWLKEDK